MISEKKKRFLFKRKRLCSCPQVIQNLPLLINFITSVLLFSLTAIQLSDLPYMIHTTDLGDIPLLYGGLHDKTHYIH